MMPKTMTVILTATPLALLAAPALSGDAANGVHANHVSPNGLATNHISPNGLAAGADNAAGEIGRVIAVALPRR